MRLCVSADTGLPLRFQSDLIKAHFNRFNDPANAFMVPTSGTPDRLNLDDARMALNGLDSFRYATTAELGDTKSKSTYFINGVYKGTSQDWQADWRFKRDQDKPDFVWANVAGKTWGKIDGTIMWLPVGDDKDFLTMVDDANPFAMWPNYPNLRTGIRQTGTTQTVGDQKCQEYLFTAQLTSAQGGQADYQLRLCVTMDSRIPLRMAVKLTSGTFGLNFMRELSHLNDPANVVESPVP
jgi:hypothetical protein